MRDIMLIIHFIGLAMGLGTSLAFMFLGIASSKMEKKDAEQFTLKTLVLSRMGHIGLTPQTASQLGGYKVQGKDAESARRLLQSARDLEAAGAFSIVLECIPAQLSEAITREVSIPTIGIGAGKYCDGQVLVTHDMVGMFEKFVPSFVKQYTNLAPQIKEAVAAYRQEVKKGSFPDDEHSFNMQLDVKSFFDD